MIIVYAATCVPRADAWEARIRLVARHVRALLARVHVDLLAYESPPLVENAQTLVKLAAIGGAMLALAEEYDLPCIGVSPAAVKVALTGDSRSAKPAMIAAARRIFGVEVSKDCADAVGVALAGEAVYRWRQLEAAA